MNREFNLQYLHDHEVIISCIYDVFSVNLDVLTQSNLTAAQLYLTKTLVRISEKTSQKCKILRQN